MHEEVVEVEERHHEVVEEVRSHFLRRVEVLRSLLAFLHALAQAPRVVARTVFVFFQEKRCVTSMLPMCWEGGWEWARLSVALDVKELDSYSYSYSYSLLIYTPGGGGQHVKLPSPFFLILA